MKIRTKITLYLGLFVFIFVATIFILNYSIIRHSLTLNAEQELIKIEKNMHRAAEALLSTAIKNYLRGITEKNMDFIQSQYDAFSNGSLTEKEAKDNIQGHFDLQQVGTSGYLVAVEKKDEKLYLDLHPYLPKQECTETEGCQQWNLTINGYTEYDWKNPTDNSSRKKAAYVLEFPPWNWIVGASSYREEFVNLVKIDDLRELIKPVRINKTGYFFLFDESDTILIHPELTNSSLAEQVNSRGQNILQLLKNNENDFITYMWKNPSDDVERMKYAVINKLEGYGWYLVGTGYLEEVYEPIAFLKNLTIIVILFAGGALLFLIYRLSRELTYPLQTMKNGIDQFDREKKPFRWKTHSITEIDVLGNAFARMSDELNQTMADLQQKNIQLATSEKQKEENRILLESIINSMPSIIIGVNRELQLTLWNSQAEQVASIVQRGTKRRLLAEVFPQLEPHLETIKTSIETNSINTHSFSHKDPDGHKHFSEMTIYPLQAFGEQEAVIRIDEVTARVEMEQHLRQSQKMDAVGQLAGGIAHDFNNMLGGIVGAAELLCIKVPEKEQGLVQIISTAAGRAGELIQKLLAFSRKETVALHPIDVHTIISDTIEILSRTLDKKIDIRSYLTAKSHTVMGDWSQLQNSLLNIGINGGHAMPDGGSLTFTTSKIILDGKYCENSSFGLSPGSFLQIVIKDSGCGIPEDHLKHIFEPFFTTKEQDKGTGLGLAAVYGAMQQHGGAITIDSEVNVGSEFVIVLPLHSGKAEIRITDEPLKTGQGCVLIIDDEPVIRTTARLMLKRLGYSTIEAENGLEGTRMFEQRREEIDLVILDMLMPVMDGTECFRKLKKIDSDVRVIISSGFTRDADLNVLKSEGMRGFVRKPYSLIELGQVINQALSK